jgi:hypothetical protein
LSSADGSVLDIADNRVILAAAEMVGRFEGIPSTVEGLRQAHDAVHSRLQANVHEMRILLAQQQIGYTEFLELENRIRELEAAEEGELEVDEEHDIDQILDESD